MRIQCTCCYCGNAFAAKPSEIKNGFARYCSRACVADDSRSKSPALFLSKIRKTDSCWLWEGARFPQGYGVFAKRKAHHRAWEDAVSEPIPPGRIIGHTCDNPPCVRNDDEGTYEVRGILYPRRGHLWLATNAANLADMSDKGRSTYGERAANAKLTDDIVREILRLKGTVSSYVLAERFGVTQSCIGHVMARSTWKHVDP